MNTHCKAAALLAATSLLVPLGSAQDGHIDPAPNLDKHDLTIARHVDTTFSLATATAGAQAWSAKLQECDSRVANDQDVATAVQINVTGTLGTFGATGDMMDIINTPAELTAVLADTSGYIKVVTDIQVCGLSTGSGIVGCADQPGSSFVIINGMSTANTGETIVHEFGHNVNLSHRETPGNPIMKATNFGGIEVNLAEAAAYHTGGTSLGPNRPTRFGFVIDDTGSMSEEIAGVRNALTTHLSTFSAADCESFQLTTFKDNVTTRVPTTDLAIIRGQVGGLIASGGGDCPEASGMALQAAGTQVRDGGRIFLATDAASRPGTNTTAIANALRARSVRVDVIVSGNCSTSAVGGTGDALRIFSEVANLTGGVFAFVPEVNSNASGRQRFENTAFNIVQGGRAEALVAASPRSVPPGVTAAVEIQGASTSFIPGTTVSFGGSGVTALGTTVLSPTRLLVDIDVAAGASGFFDATASVPAGGGTSLDVVGVGILEVGSPVTGPTIVSVQPATLEQGQVATLTVRGANTSFDATSDPSFYGAGVTVNGVTAVSATELQVDVTVDPTALVGFRSATVITNGQVATDGAFSSLFVGMTSGSGGGGSLVSIDPSSAPPGSTLSARVVGSGTSFVTGATTTSFSGTGIDVLSETVVGPETLDLVLEVASIAPPGVQDLRVESAGETLVLLDAFTVNALLPEFVAPSPCGEIIDGRVGVPLSFEVAAITNSPVPGDEITLTAAGAPAGMTFDPPLPLTGAAVSTVATWAPTAAQSGGSSVVFTIADTQGSLDCTVGLDVDEGVGFPVCPGDPNFTGVAATLSAIGSPSIAVDELGFLVEGLPPGVPTILLHATEVTSLPLGNGTLCLSPFNGGLVRMRPVNVSDVDGRLGYRIEFGADGPWRLNVSAGETLYFQQLYRETSATVNLSNAIGITFLP
jgi:hypothetical protein